MASCLQAAAAGPAPPGLLRSLAADIAAATEQLPLQLEHSMSLTSERLNSMSGMHGGMHAALLMGVGTLASFDLPDMGLRCRTISCPPTGACFLQPCHV